MAAEKTGEFALLKFLKLPPQEKWRKPSFLWSKILFDYRPSDPDGYIYYLCARTTFWLSLCLCLAYYFSHQYLTEFNLFGLVTISALSADPVSEMIAGFGYYAPRFLCYVILPLFVCLYRVNIRPREFDVMHGKIDPRWPRFSGILISIGMIGFSAIFAYEPGAIFQAFLKTFVTNASLDAFILSAASLLAMMVMAAQLGLYGIMGLWKNLNLP